tara:strand:- start:191 stop:595 length:405 start_codon:yes stop_codon:yes gene_type:complete
MGRDKERERDRESHRSKHEDSDEEDVDSEFSDTDYDLSSHELEYFSKKFGMNSKRANYLWNKQSGVCEISNIPLIIGDDSRLYGAYIVPRRITEPITDENSMIVASCVAAMRDSLGISWHQYKSLVCQIASGID